ncbi:MAG: exodeoxyribonuclease VII small subunit [Muribaculaceae bacterium]|nr:exodeoxyribonuclease VII small subunit [Muribaculaceae bacterium]
MAEENTPATATPTDENFSYNKAVAELDKILKELQSDNCDIDSMVTLTRRAGELIRACRARLTATDAELRKVLESLQTE